METDVLCKTLTATFLPQPKSILAGPISIAFDSGKSIHVSCEQGPFSRIIRISSENEVPAKDLYFTLQDIEKLLMLLSGSFLPLQKLEFSGSNTDAEKLNRASIYFLETRLALFSSANFCFKTSLIDFSKILSTELFEKWEALVNDLDIANQTYLYSLCDNKLPSDMRLAFITETAEPLIEIVSEYKNIFTSLSPGNRGTTLKNYIDALIGKYGEEIFEKEITTNYPVFLSCLVKSRVRIMHIKINQKSPHFNGEESILYLQKMSLLYRIVLFNILSIDKTLYQEKLKSIVSSLDDWNGISDAFFKNHTK